MKAARLHEYGKPPVLEDIPVPPLQPDEVLVNVKAAGMCRSDVQLIDGYFRKYADIPGPITLGHEIAGVVHEIGGMVPKASGFQEGDQVVVAPGWGDGTCRHCQVGNTHICPYVDVGLVGDRIDIPLFPRVSREQTFHGSFWGNNLDLTEVMALAAKDKIRHNLKLISFDKINENLDLLRVGEIHGRVVMKF